MKCDHKWAWSDVHRAWKCRKCGVVSGIDPPEYQQFIRELDSLG